MSIVAQPEAASGRVTETRISSYLLAEYLERLGVEVIFGLCGHTNIAFLDALGKSKIRFITTRHEQVAAHAADGYARASGKVGVLLTHLGPGLTNATTGVANAALDSIPMVVIAGDIPSYYYGRHPHQEFNLHQDADQFQIYRPFCKRVYRVDRVADLPRIMERAFHLAQSGRPGPVLVSIPMDFLSADMPVDSFQQVPAEIGRPSIDPAMVERILELLATAARPVIYAGGGVISGRATDELAALAEALEIPVAHSLMGKGAMHEEHPLLLGMTGFWGTPIANDTCRNADVMLAVGTRLAEASSSSWDPRFTFAPGTRVIHIDADLAEIGRNLATEIGVIADAKLALGALAAAARGRKHRARGDIRGTIREGRNDFSSKWAHQWSSDQFPMRPERILSELRQALPEDGYVVTDVGWNKNGVAQQFAITVPGTFVTPSGLATMGFGPSAVLGVKMAQPKRAAVALIGDGGFGSNPSVIATAMEAGLPVVWLVMDNAAFGTIAGLEQMHYGTDFGCVFECDGSRPYRIDFAAMARACGARGVMIESPDQLGPALREALAADRPTVIQAPMENAPTPTPGHWNINDIYRLGE
jgi:acetolactate synthase I/II/III large subunit